MGHNHTITRCVCGNVLAQCRCMASDKTIRTIGPCKCQQHGDDLPAAAGAVMIETRTPARQARSDKSIDAILAAAETLIARDGQITFTAAELATEARMSIGRVYYWFPDIDRVLDGVATQIVADIGQHYRAGDSAWASATNLVALIALHPALPVLGLIGGRHNERRCRIMFALLPLGRLSHRLLLHVFAELVDCGPDVDYDQRHGIVWRVLGITPSADGGKLEKLRGWKAEALLILDKWEDVMKLVPEPFADERLGAFKASIVTDYITSLQANAAELAALKARRCDNCHWWNDTGAGGTVGGCLLGAGPPLPHRPPEHYCAVWKPVTPKPRKADQ